MKDKKELTVGAIQGTDPIGGTTLNNMAKWGNPDGRWMVGLGWSCKSFPTMVAL